MAWVWKPATPRIPPPRTAPHGANGAEYGWLPFPVCRATGCRAWPGLVDHITVERGVKRVRTEGATRCPTHRAVPEFLRALEALRSLLDGEHHLHLAYCAADRVCDAITLLAHADHALGRGTTAVQADLTPCLDALRVELERTLAANLWRYVGDRPTFDRAAVRPMAQLGFFALPAFSLDDEPASTKGSLL